MSRTAACSCGQLTVTVVGEPDYVAACSCLECQKSTGSVFGVSTYWPKTALLAIAGKSTCWRRGSWKGRWLDNYFCPVCGSTLYWYAESAPELDRHLRRQLRRPRLPAPDLRRLVREQAPLGQFPGRVQAAPAAIHLSPLSRGAGEG